MSLVKHYKEKAIYDPYCGGEKREYRESPDERALPSKLSITEGEIFLAPKKRKDGKVVI